MSAKKKAKPPHPFTLRIATNVTSPPRREFKCHAKRISAAVGQWTAWTGKDTGLIEAYGLTYQHARRYLRGVILRQLRAAGEIGK